MQKLPEQTIIRMNIKELDENIMNQNFIIRVNSHFLCINSNTNLVNSLNIKVHP
jgi:hypothetical protein